MRTTLVFFGVLLLGVLPRPCLADEEAFASRWHESFNRTWVGPDCWANRLQDWRVKDGRLECVEERPLPMRTVYLLTRHLDEEGESFMMRAHVEPLWPPESTVKADARVGFLVGVGADMDHRAGALVHGIGGPGAGIFAGVDARARATVRDFGQPGIEFPKESTSATLPPSFELVLQGRRDGDSGRCTVSLWVYGPDGRVLGASSERFAGERLRGGVALVSHPGSHDAPGSVARFGFRSWRLEGPSVRRLVEHAAGPILSAQHTLHRGVLKLTAQMMPLGAADGPMAALEVRGDAGWKRAAHARIARPGFTASFRVPDWDATKRVPYRVVYDLRVRGPSRRFTWEGEIRPDPVDKPKIVLAAFTGHHHNAHGLAGRGGTAEPRKSGDWKRGMWFPHADVVEQVTKQEPDLLFFSGDQIYEGGSPTFADREHLMLDYLYKWYLWCWTWRDLTAVVPCVTIPDDHDVYQGNLWGHGGRQAPTQNHGGYVHPAAFVQMVERTQTSHLPDPVDPAPVEQDIGVYFTDLTYGRVSFAILEDRKFKSGCIDEKLPPTKTGRPDHFNDPAFDTSKLDLPHLHLLGERQERFLQTWVGDWRGADMKAALSQTVFGGLATHHGPGLEPLIADLDSNGWPQSGRNRALQILRMAFAVHVAGDQHLATVAQHGIERHRDAIWSFCVPSVANFYPRQWLPSVEGKNRPEGAPGWMGDHLDGFGNRVTIHAATNPRPTEREPKELHDRMPGFGIVRFAKNARTVTFECRDRAGAMYDGWPVTVAQKDNDGRLPEGDLPDLVIEGLSDPVVQVIDEASNEIVYTLRITGSRFRPPVYGPGPFTVRVGCPDRERWKTFTGVRVVAGEAPKTIDVRFER